MKILLAEDEKKVSHFIRKALREAGYEVETVFDGNQAIDQAGKQTFDVIILDIMMPGKDGLAVLRRLREERVGGNLHTMYRSESMKILLAEDERGRRATDRSPVFSFPATSVQY